jgi:hypothetical protein
MLPSVKVGHFVPLLTAEAAADARAAGAQEQESLLRHIRDYLGHKTTPEVRPRNLQPALSHASTPTQPYVVT